ncbi:peptidase S8/S53 domain-containing protein [Butyriboletus roseoflavus]|nr:peptidase S8/S53 domain-containing protein [Butyriboletus roseoflavus]
MPSFLLPFVLLSLALAATSDPLLSRWIPHERRSHIPSGWNLARKHDPSAVIPLRFALAQSNIEDLEEYLYDVSHPSSPNYGKHWSAGKVASTFAPGRESVDTVRDWLLESGVESHRVELSASGGWLEFKATVREAEDLLHASYNVYGHETGAEHVACESYHLPEHVAAHVDFVTPTVHFDAKLSKRSGGLKSIGLPSGSNGPKTTGQVLDWIDPDQLSHCDTHITPSCLRALYGFVYDPIVPEKNSYGIVEYTPESFRQDDLNIFAKNFSSDLYGVSPTMVSIDGGALSSQETFDINGESNLDLQYAMNLVTKKQKVTLYQVGDPVEGATFNNFLDALDGSYCTFEGGDDPNADGVYPDTAAGGYDGPEACGTVKPANVISTSYGYNEADLTVAYASRQCAEYGKLGLMGVTILYSSGDNGVAGNNDLCLNPDGTQSANGKIFNPSFPPTCPYVTSVGATQLSPGKAVVDGEDACEEIIYSSGGFSNYFAMPDYQEDTVSAYLTNTPPAYPSDIWNSTGKSRAYPDISANGANYVVAIDGNFTLVYGTSAAAPVLGAMLAMVNDARIAMGKSTVGFINPVLYAANFSDSFNDVTNGTNPGCGTLGYNTSRGWDPVTGLGTPRFPVLLAKWTAMP